MNPTRHPKPETQQPLMNRRLHLETAPPCTQYPHLFDAHEPGNHPDITAHYHAAALEICASCPIHTRIACRQWAITDGPLDDSIIAGLTGHQRRQIAITQNIRTDITPRAIAGECRKGHNAMHRYRRPDGYLRCRACERANSARQRARQQTKQNSAEWRCMRNHPADRYRTRPSDNAQYCLDCQNDSHKRSRRQRSEAITRSDETAGLRQSGGCTNGHPAARRYQRPNGVWRCADCDAASYQRRKQRRMQQRQRQVAA